MLSGYYGNTEKRREEERREGSRGISNSNSIELKVWKSMVKRG